jgi:hypothetical protein
MFILGIVVGIFLGTISAVNAVAEKIVVLIKRAYARIFGASK